MRVFQPMLLSTRTKPFDDADWGAEIKWDGFRAICYITRAKTMLLSRNGKDLLRMFPELSRLNRLLPTGVYDGEVVKQREDGLADFNSMRRRDVLATFVVFDMLQHSRRLLLNEPLRLRQKLLAEEVLPDPHDECFRSHVFDGEHASELYLEMEKRNGEGIVLKHLDSIYEPGKRSSNWVKVHTEYGRAVVAERGDRFFA